MYREIVPMAVLLIGAAVLGFSLGRLIRGPRPRVERNRPRIALSAAYLRDAFCEQISPHTRMRCAFDASYLCCCELSEAKGIELNQYAHPSEHVMRVGLLDIGALSYMAVLKNLAAWSAEVAPSMPGVSLSDACEIAARIQTKTISFLS
jgi:hypothetical protein